MALHPRCSTSSMEREQLEEERKADDITRAVGALERIADMLELLVEGGGSLNVYTKPTDSGVPCDLP